MIKVVIVGGGLAGLTAAFYLSKDPKYELIIFEAQEKLGGRVQTIDIDGFKFNYGAFMLFPWYKSYNKLLQELKYDHYSEHLDGKYEYVWNEKSHTFHEVNKKWVFDDIPVQKLIKFLPDFITHKPELYNPDPKRFGMMTVEEYFKKISIDDIESLDAVNKVAVGYTYGAISQLPMAIYFGFAKEIFLNGGFKNVSVLTSGAYKVIGLLENELRERGVKIHKSTKVDINKDKELYLEGEKIEYDRLVIASAAGDLIEPFLPKISNLITYNDHFVACIKTENETIVNGRYDWNLLYTSTMDQSEPQLTSIGNFEATFVEHPDRSLIAYLRIPTKYKKVYDTERAKKKIIELIGGFLPDAGKITIPFIYRWSDTMPIIKLEALEKIQAMQGQDNVYFAGDYLGAPSMEVAVKSGEEVARMIKQKIA